MSKAGSHNSYDDFIRATGKPYLDGLGEDEEYVTIRMPSCERVKPHIWDRSREGIGILRCWDCDTMIEVTK